MKKILDLFGCFLVIMGTIGLLAMGIGIHAALNVDKTEMLRKLEVGRAN